MEVPKHHALEPIIVEERAPRAHLLLAFAALYLVWGSTYLAIRFALETLPPFLMAGTRFLVAGSLLYGWARRNGRPAPTARHWRAAGIVGALLLFIGNGGVVWAERTVPSGLVALLVSTLPFWMVLLEFLIFRKRPGAWTIAGLLLGFCGIALLVAPGSMPDGGGIDLLATGIVLLAAIAWAAGSLYSRSASLPESPLLAASMQMLAGGVLLIALGSTAGEWAQLQLAEVSLKSWLALGYLIVFGSLIAFSAYIWLLRHAPIDKVSTYAYVNPVVAVLLGWALAGEPLTPRVLLAAAVIVGAVALIITRRASLSLA